MDRFYLHEDDWGMIDLVPLENAATSQAVASEAQRFSDEHRAPGGIGWTDAFVLPPLPHEVAERNLSVEELAALLGPEFQRLAEVLSGYGSSADPVANGFAFAGPGGTFYGRAPGGRVERLHLDRDGATEALAGALIRLGRAQRLMLCDWRFRGLVDLSDEAEVRRYLEEK